jgi:hypothetical protein
MSQAEIEDKLKLLEENNKITNKKEYAQMLHHLILSLYVLQAPRRNIDYCLMKISSDITDTNFNYLDLKNKRFIFNNYKTNHKYDTIEIPYNVHFLVWMDSEPINKSGDIIKILNKIFGRNIGSSMLRNIYLTSKNGAMV